MKLTDDQARKVAAKVKVLRAAAGPCACGHDAFGITPTVYKLVPVCPDFELQGVQAVISIACEACGLIAFYNARMLAVIGPNGELTL